jgi:hypothetical protein
MIDFQNVFEKSRDKANLMLKNGLYSRFGMSDSLRFEKALIGCIGEFAFEDFLTKNSIDYKLDTTDFTKSNTDLFDFEVNNYKLDIKVAKKTTKSSPNDNWTYGYPKEQRPETKDYVIIGLVDFKNKNVEFYGWITGKDISNFEVVTKNSFAGYNYLTPNHEFEWGDLNKNFEKLFEALKN